MVRIFKGQLVKQYPAGELDGSGDTVIGSVYANTGEAGAVAAWLEARVNVVDYEVAYGGAAGSVTAIVRTL